MSDENHITVQVLRSQYAEVCRRIEEIRSDVRIEQAETREEMKSGFARLNGRYDGLEMRVRDMEQEQERAKERMSTWRAVVPLLSGIAAGIGSWSRDLIRLLK